MEANELLVSVNIMLVIVTSCLVWAAFLQARIARRTRNVYIFEIIQRFIQRSIKNIRENIQKELSSHGIEEVSPDELEKRVTEWFDTDFKRTADMMLRFGILDKSKRLPAILEGPRRLWMFIKWLCIGELPSDSYSCLYSLLKCICKGK